MSKKTFLFITLLFLLIINTAFADTNNKNDLTLKSLTIKNGIMTPTFSSIVTTYSAVVTTSTTSIEIFAIANNEETTIQGIGARELTKDTNELNVEVIGKNNCRKTYSLNIIRFDVFDTYLSSLNRKIHNKSLEIDATHKDLDVRIDLLKDYIKLQPLVIDAVAYTSGIEIFYYNGMSSYVVFRVPR